MPTTFVLEEALNLQSEIYQQTPGGQRSRIVKIPAYRPYLEAMVRDEKGKTRRLRYKEHSNFLFADEQKKEENIDDNAKFTESERDNSWFRHGILVTESNSLINYLRAYPGNSKSPYKSDKIKPGIFKELDVQKEKEALNEDLRNRTMAAHKIFTLSKPELDDMILDINGSFFEVPSDIQEVQNLLLEWLDNTDDSGVKRIINFIPNETIDKEARLMVGRLINSGFLSFDELPNAIAKKGKANDWVKVREISATDYTPDQRVDFFVTFLTSKDGKALYDELKTEDLKSKETTSKKTKTE